MAKQKTTTEKHIKVAGMVAGKLLKKAKAPAAPVDPNDLTIPNFLKRPRDPDAPRVDVSTLLGTGRQREWIMPDKNKPKAPDAPIFVDNRSAPVEVVFANKSAGNTLLARYANMDEFEAQHDRKTYPIKQTACSQELTIVQVSPKPWAGKIGAVPGIDDPTPAVKGPKPPKQARDFSQPDAAGKPVAQGSSLGIILALMIEGKHTVADIIAKSGVEGGVVSAEDKVLHRMRFVLFRQHGVGHSIGSDGIVKAVMPSRFDTKSIFKAAKEPKPAKE